MEMRVFSAYKDNSYKISTCTLALALYTVPVGLWESHHPNIKAE